MSDTDLTEDPKPGTGPYDEPSRPGEDRNPDAKFLRVLNERLETSYNKWKDTFDTGQDDLENIYLDQWGELVRAERGERPTNTMNVLPQYINKQVSDLRKGKIDIDFTEVGGLTDPARLENMSYADIMEGIARMISYKSNAPLKFARGGQHAAESGLGWLQLEINRSETDPFSNDIYIEHIRDRWGVIIDAHASQPDFSDMRYGFVSEVVPRGEFQANYPKIPVSAYDAAPTTRGATRSFGTWNLGSDGIRVYDYYYKEKATKEFLELVHPRTRERIVNRRDMIEQYVDDLLRLGFEETRRSGQKFDIWQVKWARTTTKHILEESIDWPGRFIPLVPVVGRQIDLIDQVILLGLLHYGIEPQQMYNLWISAATERVTRDTKNPYIGSAEQIGEYKTDWEDASTNNPFVLLYNRVEGEPPPTRNLQTPMPIAELQMAETLLRQIQQATGMYDALMGKRSNETSGKAIQERADSSADSMVEFSDNVAVAVRAVGIQLADLIPKIYTGDRLVSIMDEEGQTSSMPINHYIVDRENPDNKFLANGLTLANYEVRATIGPATVTRRREFAETMSKMFQNSPKMIELLGDLFFRAIDFPFSKTAARRLKSLMPRHVLSRREQEQMPEREPTPEEVIAQEENQAAQAKLEAEKVTAARDIEVAKIEYDKASIELQTARVKAGMEFEKGQVDLEKGRQDLEGAQISRDETRNNADAAQADRDKAQAEAENEEDLEKTVTAIVRKEIAEHARTQRHANGGGK